MPLRIALDTRRVADFGIGTYIRNLVRALACVDDRNHYLLISTEQAAGRVFQPPAEFRNGGFYAAEE